MNTMMFNGATYHATPTGCSQLCTIPHHVPGVVRQVTVQRQPVQQRAVARRDSILNAAEEIIDEYGPFSPELSARAIAERAGTSAGTLYHYFPDLDSLVAAVTERFMEAVIAETASARTSHGSWVEQLAQGDTAFRAIFRRRPGLRELWFNPRAPSAVAEIHQRYHRLLAARSQQWFYECTGVRLSLTVHLVLVTMIGALLELAFRDKPGGDPRIFAEIRRVQIVYYGSHLASRRGAQETEPFV
jgi:AcrR family transcriptional regulator